MYGDIQMAAENDGGSGKKYNYASLSAEGQHQLQKIWEHVQSNDLMNEAFDHDLRVDRFDRTLNAVFEGNSMIVNFHLMCPDFDRSISVVPESFQRGSGWKPTSEIIRKGELVGSGIITAGESSDEADTATSEASTVKPKVTKTTKLPGGTTFTSEGSATSDSTIIPKDNKKNTPKNSFASADGKPGDTDTVPSNHDDNTDSVFPEGEGRATSATADTEMGWGGTGPAMTTNEEGPPEDDDMYTAPNSKATRAVSSEDRSGSGVHQLVTVGRSSPGATSTSQDQPPERDVEMQD